MRYSVYLLASSPRGTLYIGVTNDLIRRVHQHREGVADGFTRKYGVKLLVWFDSTTDVLAAIAKEKQLKSWRRAWKLRLVEQANPSWRDLYPDLLR